SPAEVIGGAIAVLCWIGVLVRLSVRTAVIFSLFLILVILQALEPFCFASAAGPFTWVPFHGFLHGSIVVNVRSFLEKTFMSGTCVCARDCVGTIVRAEDRTRRSPQSR